MCIVDNCYSVDLTKDAPLSSEDDDDEAGIHGFGCDSNWTDIVCGDGVSLVSTLNL